MRKLSTLSLTLLLTLPWVAGCSHTDQGPTAEKTVSPGGIASNPNYRPNGQNVDIRGMPEPISGVGAGNGETPPVRMDVLPSNIDWDHPPADMILVTVHFDFDQFNIQTADRPLLEAAAKTMAADPSIRVVAVGHCDHYGSDQYNLALSDRRANSVKGYLIRNGAGDGQTEILARGKFGAAPDAKKNSPEAMNDRRVDVIKIPAGATLPTGTPSTAVTPAAAP